MTREELSYQPMKKILNDVYLSAKGPLKQGLLQCLTDVSQDKQSRYAKNIMEVKTIWQVDKTVNISEFYYPTTICFDSTKKIVNTTSTLFEESRSVIIEGIAGQGKSIFLRYACSKCIEKNEGIPVFIQLRHVSDSISLEDLVRDAFKSLGISENIWVIEHFLRSGKLLFLLDGFDEVDEKHRSETIKIIEEYIHAYKKLRVAITSRPNSDIQHSTTFSVSKINPLHREDREKLISTLVVDYATKHFIIDSLKSRENVSSVLTTPLLVTLLVITYKSEKEIPENLTDFYRTLFITLIKRHDKTKPGFIRKRVSSLGNTEFEKVFETISFLALSNYKIDMTEREFHSYCLKSLAAERIENVSAESVIIDITKITSLVVLDGEKYFFLHKSICEYFAAQKIAEEPDRSIKSYFYKKLCDTDIPDNWYQTLNFLSEIDTYDFCHWLLLPYYAKAFNVSQKLFPSNFTPFTRETLMDLIGQSSTIEIRKKNCDAEAEVRISITSKNWLVNEYLRGYIDRSFTVYLKECVNDTTLNKMSEINPRYSFINSLFNEARLWPDFLSFINLNSPLKLAYEEVLNLIKDLEQKEEATKPIFDINI